MSVRRTSRMPRRAFAPLALGITAVVTPLQGVAQAAEAWSAAEQPVSLEQQMRGFLARVGRGNADSVAVFFPRQGDWTYIHTRHRAGGDSVGLWRIPGAETARAAWGPLQSSFWINPHGQPVGRFVHQVRHRPGEWRRVRGNRFVPPGASAASRIFVEWRREGGEWVISELADESFGGVPLPSWCC